MNVGLQHDKRGTRPSRRLWQLLALAAVATTAATSCGPNTDAYVALQNAMKSHITNVDHRPVASVSCTPHVHDTMREETAHLRCLVRFRDGTSYTASAAIRNQNSGGTHNRPDAYTWDSPPPAG
ncbi:hypothetical protein [Streptomyces sp. ICBB 8177]|uniref:hypothetical protein n=1 Tax=Streptomyces sp. ICBB 8177 TaxID=563922 RepID=UPI000D674369|nr:hypothetical protein [Streptomyces sp. ICBB 8177]PWI43007.1 hypothetical protein CK485_12280 [Streptomyces sp. ICBB 8177]